MVGVGSYNYTKLFLAYFLLALVCTTSYGQDLETQAKALKIISDFAKEICGGPVPLEGKSDSLDLSGNAKAKLNSAIAKVVDLGIEGAAKYQNEEYEGLLRADLTKTLSESKDCKLKVWSDLKEKLLGSLPAQDTKPTPLSQTGEVSRTCKYTTGPKVGQIEYFPPSVPIIPALVGQPCQDGRGNLSSWGYAIPDQK